MVVFFHSPIPQFRLQFGWAGVNLFFILSGFLITRILLHGKTQSFKTYATTFYTRRALRIFPLYYFYLTTSILLLKLLPPDTTTIQAIADFNNNYPYLFTYTYNFEEIIHFLQNKNYENSLFYGHLWSLSVEEQFYLLYPILVYYTPLKWLKKMLLLLIVVTPLLRLLFTTLATQYTADVFWIGDVLYISTIFQLDALSLGGCLAIFKLNWIVKYWTILFTSMLVLLVTIGILHLTYFNVIPGSSLGYDVPVFHLLHPTPSWLLTHRYLYTLPLLNFFFALIILLAIHHKLVLKNRLLIKIGKISYGIYIYHLALSYFFSLAIKNSHQLPMLTAWTLMAFYLIILCTLAYLSYRFLETPFLRLKKN